MSRMLFLLPSAPWPSDGGAKIRNGGLLRLLSRDHEVDAITFGSEAVAPDLRANVARLTVIPPAKARSRLRRAREMATSDLPDMAWRLWSPAFEDAVQRSLCERTYAAVQAEGIEMARYLHLVRPEQRVYDAHNAEFLLQARLASSTSPVARAYSTIQTRRLERFEGWAARTSRLTLAVSNHDANQLLALAGPRANVQVVPNGVDTSAYPFRPPAETGDLTLLFVGKQDFRPNSEALAWFVPSVLRHMDRVRLFAVGAAPPNWLVKAGQHDERIAATGYVEDERPYLARATALVLPLRTGGGSRLKALVAMAAGVPIVSTRLGMEGIDAEPGMHYLVADSAAEWVSALRRMRSEPNLRRQLACNARILVEQRYDWSVIQRSVRDAYAWLPG